MGGKMVVKLFDLKIAGIMLVAVFALSSFGFSLAGPDAAAHAPEWVPSLFSGVSETIASPVKGAAALFSRPSNADSNKAEGPLGLIGGIGKAVLGVDSANLPTGSPAQRTAESVPSSAVSANPSAAIWTQSRLSAEKVFVPPEREESYFLKRKIESVKKCPGCAGGLVDVSEASLSKALQKVGARALVAGKGSVSAEKKVAKGISKSSAKKTGILVEVNDSNGLQATAAFAKSLGGDVKFAGSIGNVVSVELPENMAYELAQYAEVKSISRDGEVSALLLDSISKIDANFAVGTAYSGYGVRVAVIDTGIEKENSMLLGKVVAEADFSTDGTANDLHGHGTHIAGIISGSSLNGGAFNGVAPGSMLINAKALDRRGFGKMSSVIQAMNFAVNPDGNVYTDDGARIINLSFGAIGDFNGSPLESTIDAAESMGVVVVVSAGNCGTNAPSPSCSGFTGLTFPGSMGKVITVGSVDRNGNISGFSSHGFAGNYSKPDIVAPGQRISSSWVGNTVNSQSGTSMSAAFVSGVTALLLDKDPLLSPVDVKRILALSAKDLGVEGSDELYGFGIVDANAALNGIDSVASKLVVQTSEATKATVGLDGPPFEAKIRLFNNSLEEARIRDYAADSWLNVAYPTESLSGNSSYVVVSADQKELGVGIHSTELLLAINDYIVSHEIELNVVEGAIGSDANAVFEVEISKPASIRVEGTDASGKVGRGKTISIIPKFVNPFFDSDFYYSNLLVAGPSSYSCDTAAQKYWQVSNGGKEVSFSYMVPQNAPLGSYNVKANSWLKCTGQAYDGSCYPSSSYSCTVPSFVHEFTATNLFQVVSGCTEGACCNTNYNTFKPSSTVCKQRTGFEYYCPQGAMKGGDVFIKYYDQYCSGNSASCDGLTQSAYSEKYLDCGPTQTCDAATGTCKEDPVTCYKNEDCGASGLIESPFCSNDSTVSQKRIDYTCVNAGQLSSYCTSAESTQLISSCTANRECSSGACIDKVSDECEPAEVGTSWCDGETGTVQTCYFNPTTLSYKKKYETCGLGVCVEGGAAAYCDNSQRQFSLEAEKSGLGIPIFKQPGDRVRIAIVSRTSAPQSVLLLFDSAAFVPAAPDCASGSTKILSSGANYCDYNISTTATRKPYSYTVSKGTTWASRTINVVLPQTVIVTDSEKLEQRYPNDYWRVSGLMLKLYQKAFENQGVVYDLADYRSEIGVRPPFDSFSYYKETLGSPTIVPVNEYVGAVSSFLKKRCPIQYCKHVLIVGDDFVIPMLRVETARLDPQTGQWTSEIIFVDKPYISTTTRSIGDTNEFFGKYSSVAVVVPDRMPPELRSSVDLLKQTIKQKYGLADFSLQEYNASQISCNFYFGHPLQGKTVVLIGTAATNQAIGCLRYLESPENTFSVESSPWGSIGTDKKFVLILNTDSARVVQLTGMLLENGLMREKNYVSAEFFDDSLDTCGMIGYIPGIDVVGDVCTVGKDCGHFLSSLSGFEKDNGQGMWCGIGGGIAIIVPGFSIKWAKTIGKYMEDSHFARAVGSTGSEWAESIFQRFEGKFVKAEAEEAAQLTVKASGRGVIRPRDTILEDKLGEYTKAVRTVDPAITDPMEQGGIHQLIKMSRPRTDIPNLIVQVGNTERVTGVVVIKKGEHLSEHKGFGIEHAWAQHSIELQQRDILSKEQLAEKLDDIITNGKYRYNLEPEHIQHEFSKDGITAIVSSTDNPGSFQTVIIGGN